MKNYKALTKVFPSLLALLMLIGTVNTTKAQGQYEAGMGQAFALWTEQKPIEASAMFERIAKAEKDNWIPYYYAANTLIVASFESKDATKTNEILKKAASFLEAGHAVSPDNSELITMEGLMYTGYVAMAPETYAMQYSNKIMNLHEKALSLDKDNPRAHLNKLEFEMGGARFFGKDMATFCPGLEELRPLFANQKAPEPFYPSYGDQRIATLKKQCGCK